MITVETLRTLTSNKDIVKVDEITRERVWYTIGDDTLSSYSTKDRLIELAHDYLIDHDYTVTASTSSEGNVVSAISYEKDSYIGTDKDMYEAFMSVIAKVLEGN